MGDRAASLLPANTTKERACSTGAARQDFQKQIKEFENEEVNKFAVLHTNAIQERACSTGAK